MNGPPTWLKIVETFAPMVLAFTPAAPLAPFVAHGIQVAEGMRGADNGTKLATAIDLVNNGVAGANAQAGHQIIDPQIAQSLAGTAISTVVQVSKILAAGHTAINTGTDVGTGPLIPQAPAPAAPPTTPPPANQAPTSAPPPPTPDTIAQASKPPRDV